jgi:hypothetical protein
MTEAALQIYRNWIIDFRVNCPTHHWQTSPVERGHLIHQDSMSSMASYADTPAVLWAPEFLLSVEVHNVKLCKGLDKCPYTDLTGLLPDARFLYIWGSLAIVHNHSLNPDKFHPRGLPCIYDGTGFLENVHGGKILDPATGLYLFSTNMTVDENFLPFRELRKLESNPAAVHDCFGISAFRHLVAWTFINKRIRKCFDNAWHLCTNRSLIYGKHGLLSSTLMALKNILRLKLR